MYKPFVELFRTPNRNYFYEPNKNEFIAITAESYEYLKKVFDGREDSLEMPNEIKELLDMGYLAEKSVVEKVEHPYTQYIDSVMQRKIHKITLQVTQNCNFRCKYCIYSEEKNGKQRTHSNKSMSWEIAKQAVDFLLDHSVDCESVNIGFYGGEPLIEFSLIKKVIDYAEKIFIGKEVTFSITTNATLLNEDIIYFFAQHNVNLLISLDGPKAINDKGRVFADGRGTFDTVIEKLRLIKTLDKEYFKKVHFSMVINPENDFDCINAIEVNSDYIDKWNIFSSLLDTEYESEELHFSEKYEYKKEYHNFLALLSKFNRINKESVSSISYAIIDNIFEELDRFEHYSGLTYQMTPGGPCIAGQIRLFLDTDGNFFPCERVSEKSQIMKIGNLSDGFDLNQITQLINIGRFTSEICKKCWNFKMCSLCAKSMDDGTENFSTNKKLSLCNQSKASTQIMFENFLMLNEIPEIYSKQIRIKEKNT